jgi:hypothetical protein
LPRVHYPDYPWARQHPEVVNLLSLTGMSKMVEWASVLQESQEEAKLKPRQPPTPE